MRRALSVGNNLAIRGIIGDFLCKRCGSAENELHILLLCPFAQKTWDLAPLHRRPSASLVTSIPLMLESARLSLSLPPVGILSAPLSPWILWQLWKFRNLLVFENRATPEEDSISRAVLAAKEWQDSQGSLLHQDPISRSVSPSEAPPRFLPCDEVSFTTLPLTEAVTSPFPCIEDNSHVLPPNEVVLCFVDAAWSGSSGCCGMGWLFKTHLHRVFHKGSATRSHTPSALASEALALKSALITTSQMDLTSIIVLSDCQVLISVINSETSTNEFQGILHDIAFLSRSFSFIKFSFVPRKFNSLADALAKAALSGLIVPST